MLPLAEDLAVLDNLGGGRTELGVSMGYAHTSSERTQLRVSLAQHRLGAVAPTLDLHRLSAKATDSARFPKRRPT